MSARATAARTVARTRGSLREHWLFAGLFAAGFVLRAVTFFAYRPALVFTDSAGYIANSLHLGPRPLRPFGYPVMLRILPMRWGLEVVPLVQHLMGLALAVCIYAVLLRLGVSRWLAALATAPVLLDAMQLNLEQQVLSETLFEVLLLGACVLVLWRPRPALVAAAAAGALLAGATLTRSVAMLVIGPLVLTALFRRIAWPRLVAMLAAFALPLLLYAAWFHSSYGIYGLNGLDGHFLYARVAPFAQCSGLSMPDYERVLCPTQPVGHRPTVEQYSWSKRLSPIYHLHLPARLRDAQDPWLPRSQVAGDFAQRVILHQPVTYARTVAADFLRGFSPQRTSESGEVSVGRWKFKTFYPIYPGGPAVLRRYGEVGRVSPALASFLHSYQTVGYTPGPLLGLALVVGLVGALGIGRARRSGLRSACFLFSTAALVVLVTAVAVNQFSWRYQLPQLILLPPAGVLGLTALAGWSLRGSEPEPEPVEAAPAEPELPPAAQEAGSAGRPDDSGGL